MNPYRRRAAWLLLLLAASCSSNASAPTGQKDAGGQQDISNVIYLGGVTDEALIRLLDVPAKNDARQALLVTSPDLSAPLAKDSPAAWQFQLASEASRAPTPRLRPARAQSTQWRRSLHEVLQLLTPVRVAHAHGAPYNGTAYYLVFSDADGKQRLQVFTTETSFTPEAVDWQNLVQAPQPLKLEITSAFFEDNDVPTDGGPFIGGTFPFRIE
ncbi:MAG TPA: hypothetical protein VJV79_06645 [Polyangiaceae bacterium]|nr:hypothetical protein [Polyangiaceae bacterium]